MAELDAEVTQVLEEARRVFGRRPPPLDVSYCDHCFDVEEIRRLLRKEPTELTPEELDPILWDAFNTWGDWPSLAFYVPRLLEFYARVELRDDEMLFNKLLRAARPEQTEQGSPAEALQSVGVRMAPDERRVLFRTVRGIARVEMRSPDLTAGAGRLVEALAFLAAFEAPVAPLIEEWKIDSDPIARGRFCLLLADCFLTWDRARLRVPNTYLSSVKVLPENAAAIAALLDREFAIVYLADHGELAAAFGPLEGTPVSQCRGW